MSDTTTLIPAEDARSLLLDGLGLLADPGRRATPAAVHRQVERMGFVQVDTINVVERAHHHILFSRFEEYRPPVLKQLLEQDRRLFEHWTHDAAVIPTQWFHIWKRRFADHARGALDEGTWWHRHMEGKPKQVIRHVRRRIGAEGPLMSRDFQHDGPTGSWWGWKPQKAALEYLWFTGVLAVARRENFSKVYDLIERVFPEAKSRPASDERARVDWVCRGALERLGVADPAEIAGYFHSIKPTTAQQWCERASKKGEVIEVEVESVDSAPPRRAYAMADWRRRLAGCPAAPDAMRLLNPFDPALHDRARTERLFGFDFRFEGFVPAPKRKYGYYVLAMLEGDRLVGRLDPKLHRDRSTLEIKGVWWEPKIKVTKARRAKLDEALDAYARFLGADHIEMAG